METLTLDPRYPGAAPLQQAADTVRGGGICVFPTETVYGLGGNGFDPAVVERVADLKGRPAGKPMGLIVADGSWIRRLCVDVPPAAERLAAVFWPGPLTIVLRADECIPESLRGPGGTVGLRQSGLSLCSLLAEAADCPLIATSANLADGEECTTPDMVPADIRNAVDLVIDGGPVGSGTPSTVVDMTDGMPRIIRRGTITISQISAVFKKD